MTKTYCDRCRTEIQDGSPHQPEMTVNQHKTGPLFSPITRTPDLCPTCFRLWADTNERFLRQNA